FWYISWQTGYVYEDLIAANPGISQYVLILPGQFIRLPKKTPGPTATPATPTATPAAHLIPRSWYIYLPLIAFGD
ncbi:MAG TPA: LysM peptidoglycan-binding domain-containing protein, partial [Anaerolineales bacterium]|nr:LysM peptidoglycan-binding domain-containing protein [Anaerolineales bacterium]